MGNNVTQVAFKNWALFITCITKIDGRRIDDAEDFNLSMPMSSLFEYCLDFFDTTVYGFIQKMQLILMLILLMVIILNFSATKLSYWETQSEMWQMDS